MPLEGKILIIDCIPCADILREERATRAIGAKAVAEARTERMMASLNMVVVVVVD